MSPHIRYDRCEYALRLEDHDIRFLHCRVTRVYVSILAFQDAQCLGE
jgi:hypothetical protein